MASDSALEQQFPQAHARLVRTLAQTQAMKTELHPRVEQHTSRFVADPARSPGVKQFAKRVDDELAAFRRIDSAITTNLAIQTVAGQARIGAAGVALIDRVLRSQPGDRADNPAKALEEAAGAIWLPLIDIYDAACCSMLLHEATLRSFLGEHVDRSPTVIVEAMVNTFEDQTREAVLNTFEIVLGRLAEDLSMVMTIARIWIDIRQEVLKLHEPYDGAGPVDHLDRLGIALARQNGIFASANEAVRALGG